MFHYPDDGVDRSGDLFRVFDQKAGAVTKAWLFAPLQVRRIANAWGEAMEFPSSISKSTEALTSRSMGPTKSRPSSRSSREGAANFYAKRSSPARRNGSL